MYRCLTQGIKHSIPVIGGFMLSFLALEPPTLGISGFKSHSSLWGSFPLFIPKNRTRIANASYTEGEPITMKRVTAAFGVLIALAHKAAANVDLISLYASNGATIVEASATLVLPSTPNPISGDVALWRAIQLDSDFIQGVSETAPAGLGYCTNLGANWCNFAYALTPSAQNGDTVIAAPGAKVRTHCTLVVYPAH